MKFLSAIVLVVLALAATQSSAIGEEGFWNQYRGPNGDGRTLAKSLPIEFGETQKVRWKTAIPGRGFSSPVVWDDQIWLTTAPLNGKQLYAIAVDLHSGKILHNIKVFDVVDPNNAFDKNSHASPTLVVEQGRIYVHFGRNGTACLDTKTGTKLWATHAESPVGDTCAHERLRGIGGSDTRPPE